MAVQTIPSDLFGSVGPTDRFVRKCRDSDLHAACQPRERISRYVNMQFMPVLRVIGSTLETKLMALRAHNRTDLHL